MTAAPVAVPPPPRRDPRLDALRGLLQLIIFTSHAYGSFIGAWLLPKVWGLSDSSEQFVFLSGLALGSVFARNRLRSGYGAASRDLGRRAFRLWRTHLVVFALFSVMVFAVAWATRDADAVVRNHFAFLAEAPLLAALGAAAMLYQPAFMGILPVFVCCMLMLPGFMWLLGMAGTWALAAPILLWSGVQIWGWAPPSLGGTEVAFNPLAWQILFLSGAWLGQRLLLGQGPLPFARWLTIGALAMVLFGLVVQLSEYGFLPIAAIDATGPRAKEDLALAVVLHSFAVAWLAARLLPAPQAAVWGWAINRALGRIGRHSLTVFCVGLFLSFGTSSLFRLVRGDVAPDAPFVLDVVAIGLGSALLYLLAWWLERPKPAKAPMRMDTSTMLRE